VVEVGELMEQTVAAQVVRVVVDGMERVVELVPKIQHMGTVSEIPVVDRREHLRITGEVEEELVQRDRVVPQLI
jgi:hypothetical protein